MKANRKAIEEVLKQDILLANVVVAKEGESKGLYYNPFNDEYKVFDDGKLVSRNTDLYSAIETYNNI